MANVPDKPATQGVSRRVAALAMLRRIAHTLLLTLLVVLSLLTFPSSIPWLVAFWLAWHTLALARSKPGWVPLVACVGILLVKRVYWPGTLLVLGPAMLLVAAAAQRGWLRQSRRRQWAATLVLWCGWAAFLLQWRVMATCNHSVRLDKTRAVVCLGDSITSGLLPDRGYPAQLQKLLSVPVVNLGQSGSTIEGAFSRLSRLDELGIEPQVVVIELGGHDFLKGRTRAATRQSLEQLIDMCQARGAEVVLMEIPRGFMTDPYWGLERELAQQHDLQLVSDSGIRQFVLWSPISPPGMWLPDSHLSDDGIHSNPRGSAYLARHVAASLCAMYGPGICGDDG